MKQILALVEWTLLLALSRLEQYKAEYESFERKYGMSLEKFEVFLHREKGVEGFYKEEDLEDWEFCFKALRWWEEKVKGLQRASNTE
jgi:hypothetical protein